jgi:alkyl hydroperoxide reductase subunit F
MLFRTTMLDLKAQLQAYLERVQQPFELVASLDDSAHRNDMRELLETIQACAATRSPCVRRQRRVRKPSFSLHQPRWATSSLRFAGLPLGHEFTSWCWPCCGPAATHPRWKPT